MPQLDVSTFLPQVFWLAALFFILYCLMRWLAMPRVGAAIDARRRRLEDDLSRATQLKAEAEAVLAGYEKTLATARAEAQATMRETAERLAAEAAERQRQLAATLAQQIEAAEGRIAAAKDSALSEIRGIAIEVARSVAEKLVGSAADDGKLRAAVDRAMAERAA